MNPKMTIVMKNQKRIEIELTPQNCENSFAGFVEALAAHAFDNMAIERVVPGFVIQPWCMEEKLPPEYNVICDGEFYSEAHHFEAFSVGLAGEEGISCPWCFFITVGDAFHLNQKFARIGKVIRGFEELKRIERCELVDVSDKEGVAFMTPLKDEVIETIVYESDGYQPIEFKRKETK